MGALGEVVYEVVVVVVVGMNAHVEVFECFEDLEWVGRSGSREFADGIRIIRPVQGLWS